MSCQLKRPAPAGRARRDRIRFSVSLAADAADLVGARLAILHRPGFRMTRSGYFELLARHDSKHKIIEKILTPGG